jgi:hypothetical protein
MASDFYGLALEIAVLSLALYLDSYLHGQLTLVRPIDVRQMLSHLCVSSASTFLVIWMLGDNHCVLRVGDGMCLCTAAIVGANAWLVGGHFSVPVVLLLESLPR